jgi:hypothetical protein
MEGDVAGWTGSPTYDARVLTTSSGDDLMDFERWTEAARIFERAVELAGRERPSYIARACGRDLELRSLVERMLASDEARGNVLDRGVGWSPERSDRDGP